jgi:hypothetical protein
MGNFTAPTATTRRGTRPGIRNGSTRVASEEATRSVTNPAPGEPPSAAAPALLRLPAPDAEGILRQTIHQVADIPQDFPQLVWLKGADELLVRTKDVSLACDTGLVTITLTVNCDQLQEPDRVTVPLAVGTAELPTGLVMATLTRPLGPAVVVDAWAEPLTAFAWEALLHLAQTVSAGAGEDPEGRPLVPATIGAEQRLLLVQPAARHAFVPRSSAQVG